MFCSPSWETNIASLSWGGCELVYSFWETTATNVTTIYASSSHACSRKISHLSHLTEHCLGPYNLSLYWWLMYWSTDSLLKWEAVAVVMWVVKNASVQWKRTSLEIKEKYLYLLLCVHGTGQQTTCSSFSEYSLPLRRHAVSSLTSPPGLQQSPSDRDTLYPATANTHTHMQITSHIDHISLNFSTCTFYQVNDFPSILGL